MDAKLMITGRRSVRKFKDEIVSHDTIKKIVKLATYSPTWKNSQTVRYTIVEDKKTLKKIADEAVLDFKANGNVIKGAAGLAVLSTVTGRCGYERDGSFTTSKEDRWEMFDAGVTTQTFCLAAHEAGIGTVIIGVFDESKLSKIIELPAGQTVSVIIAYGAIIENPPMPRRKELDEVLKFL
ncbi:nitroreductase family protein [Sedimentibacter sp. zth1]|uniref:nitroreductase family protein n=1 Tax=Sedimentibacter sp. zth1 TaxID=2816908 RepID=UPI001A92258C|nr:nitroreductase family protein [Sedimentibacter sp. zth1]QSX06346.1 nitroreductase family protein [Sedimentibacter sp. zth1]